MESYNTSNSKRTALSEVSNTQKSKGSAIKRWLQSDTRDSDSSKESPEEREREPTTQKTVIFNGTREINIPAPRKVASPTKVTWYYLPRVVIPIVSPPEVTINKPNFKSNESSVATIKKTPKKARSITKNKPSNNNSLLNWFSPTISSKGQKSGSNNIQNETSLSNPIIIEDEDPFDFKDTSSKSQPNENVNKRRRLDESESILNTFIASLPTLESEERGAIDMNLIADILRLYDFIVKFEKPLGLNLEYNGNRLKYDHLEEMILDNRYHTRLAFLQSELLSFLYKESEEGCDIDLVNIQYYLTERYPDRKCLLEKEYSEFSPRERMSIFIDLMNEALRTNKIREFIKELSSPSYHKKENDVRTAKMKEINFKINEIRAGIANKENELKDIEKQLEEKTTSFESDNNNIMNLPNAITKRQKIVAKRKAEQGILSDLNEQRKDAADEIELLLNKLDKLEMESKELNMLNKTERNHASCILRGGSILNPLGRDERFYTIVRLGQDRNGKYYWFFRTLGGVFIETIKWNYPEQDSDNSSLPLTSPSEWQLISGVGKFRMFMAVLNNHSEREKSLKSNLKILEKEIEHTFDGLNSWLEKKRDDKSEQMEVEAEEVKSIMCQRQKSFWKLFDTVIRKKDVWSLEEYHVIMSEYVKRKIVDFEKILRHVDPNLVFKEPQPNLRLNAVDFVNEVKDMISETGLKFAENDNSSTSSTLTTSTTSSKKDKSWDWLYNVASDWYLLDIKTFSTLAAWLDVMVDAGEPVVRSIKKRMREELAEKFKCPMRLRDKKKVVEYKEESIDNEIEEIDTKEQNVPQSKWSLRERKRVAYK